MPVESQINRSRFLKNMVKLPKSGHFISFFHIFLLVLHASRKFIEIVKYLLTLFTIVVTATMVMANKNPKAKKSLGKDKTNKPTYIDSLRIVQNPKHSISTETSKRKYFIESKDSMAAIPRQYYTLALKYAEKMHVSPRELSNLALYSFIDSWYGTRYVYGGTSRRGIDCSAFVRELYRNVYKTDILRTSILQYRAVQKIKDKTSLKEGDLIFFNTRGRGVSHVGVYLKNGYFVHSSSSRGVSISSIKNSYWSSKYISGGRLF